MKCFILTLFCLGMAGVTFAGELSRPFREGKSNYVTDGELQAARSRFKKTQTNLLTKVQGLLDSEEQSPDLGDFERVRRAVDGIIAASFSRKTFSPEEMNALHTNVWRLAREAKLIDDSLFRLLIDHTNSTYPPSPEDIPAKEALKLSEYYAKKRQLISLYHTMSGHADDSLPEGAASPFPSKHFKFSFSGHRELSARDLMLYKYSASEIRSLANVMKFSLSVADAESVTTTIKFRDGEDPLVLQHSPTEQYRLSLRLLRMKKTEIERSIGKNVKDIELIIAAFETGVISYNELSLIVTNKDFYSPEVPFIRKALGFVGKIATTALEVNPATAPYVIVPMILYNAYVEGKNANSKVDEDSFIFDLPQRGGH